MWAWVGQRPPSCGGGGWDAREGLEGRTCSEDRDSERHIDQSEGQLPPGVQARPSEGVSHVGRAAAGSVPRSPRGLNQAPAPHHPPSPLLPDLCTQRQRLCLTKLTSLHRLDNEMRDGRTGGEPRNHPPRRSQNRRESSASSAWDGRRARAREHELVNKRLISKATQTGQVDAGATVSPG